MNIRGPAAAFLLCVSTIVAMGCPSSRIEPATPNSPEPPRMDTLMIRGGSAIRWSNRTDDKTRQEFSAGQRQIEIVLHRYRPPAGAAMLVVSLVIDHHDVVEVDRFSVHPNQSFVAGPGTEPQRFLISLAGHAEIMNQDMLELQVGFDAESADAEGGEAEIEIHPIDTTP